MHALAQPRRPEAGFTLIEVLVVLVVIGALAAVAVPAFTSQGSKGSDAEAKSLASAAAKAIESCAAQNGGSYERCSKEALLAIEPSLGNAADRLAVSARASSYEIGVAAQRDPAVSFRVSRASDGTTTRTCTTNEDRGGCRVPTTGTW